MRNNGVPQFEVPGKSPVVDRRLPSYADKPRFVWKNAAELYAL
jgi:hypothetical protein